MNQQAICCNQWRMPNAQIVPKTQASIHEFLSRGTGANLMASTLWVQLPHSCPPVLLLYVGIGAGKGGWPQGPEGGGVAGYT